MKEGTSHGKTIQSVEFAMEIVEVIRDLERAGVTEIASELDRSKSTVHHYVTSLAKHDYLDNVDGKYQLSLRFLTLGGQVREREQLYHLGKDAVDKLASQTGERVRLVVEWNRQGITLYQSSGEKETAGDLFVGGVEELYCTAAGKALLAELPDEEVNAYLAETDLRAHTENTITNPTALLQERGAIKQRGVAFDDEERYDGVRCVGATISPPEHDRTGVLTVSAPTERMPEERFRQEIPNQLQNVAGVVQVNTTYSDWIDSS